MDLLETNWANITLEKLFTHIIGGDWGKDESYEDDDYKMVSCIRGSEFKNWKNDYGSTAVRRKIKLSSLMSRCLNNNDILLEISGGGPDQPVGRTVLITQSIINNFPYPAVCTNFLRLMRPVKNISATYLNYYLNKFYLSGEVTNYQGGSNNLRNLKFKEYSKINIPIPSINEQKIIAEKLDLLLAQVQETKSRLEQIPELLKQFRQSVLSDACFCEFSTNSDKYQFWKKSSLKELTTKIGSGSTPKGGNNVYKNKGIPLVRSMNIYSNYIKYDDLAYIDDEQAKKLANVEIQPDDILLNITGASIGRVNIAPQLFVGGRVNQHVSIIRCKKQKLLPKFLQIYLASPEIQKWIVKENYGATRQALTKSMIERLIISYPSIQEQNEIVRRVEQLFAYADKIEQQVNTALEKVNHLPQSILAKAFRGELTAQWRTKNPDLITGENSAASLLEKIQIERAQHNKKKK